MIKHFLSFALIKKVSSGWSFLRLIRLGVGSWALVQSFDINSPILGVLGGLFLLQALTNTGCGEWCKIDNHQVSEEKTIEYDEIR